MLFIAYGIFNKQQAILPYTLSFIVYAITILELIFLIIFLYERNNFKSAAELIPRLLMGILINLHPHAISYSLANIFPSHQTAELLQKHQILKILIYLSTFL